MPSESIVFSPEVDERQLDRETDQVNEQLHDVGQDVPVTFDAEEMDGLMPAGAGGGGGRGGGIGAGGAAGIGSLASRIPKPVAGVTAAAAIPIAIAGGVGLSILSAMQNASARLQTSTALLGIAADNVWRPLGDDLDKMFVRPAVMDLVKATQEFEETWENGQEWEAVAGLASDVSEGFANLPVIGEQFKNSQRFFQDLEEFFSGDLNVGDVISDWTTADWRDTVSEWGENDWKTQVARWTSWASVIASWSQGDWSGKIDQWSDSSWAGKVAEWTQGDWSLKITQWAESDWGKKVSDWTTDNWANVVVEWSLGDWSGKISTLDASIWTGKIPDFSDLKLPDVNLPDWADISLPNPKLPDWANVRLPDTRLPDWMGLSLPDTRLPDWTGLRPDMPDWSNIDPPSDPGGTRESREFEVPEETEDDTDVDWRDIPAVDTEPEPDVDRPPRSIPVVDTEPEPYEDEMWGNLASMDTGGRVTETGAAKVHRDELVTDEDRLVRELANAIDASGSNGGGREGSQLGTKLDDVKREIRALRDVMNREIVVNGETVGRVAQEGQRDRITDADPLA